MVLGAIVESFIIAQEHFLSTDSDRLVPLEKWKKFEMGDAILKCGLAEVREKGIYVRGSNEQFAWLTQRSDAGKRSAEAKAERKNLASTSVNDRSTTVNGSQPLTLTLSQKEKEKNIMSSGSQTTTQEASQDVQKIFDLWNEHRGPLPEARVLTRQRIQKVKARLKEIPDPLGWELVIQYLSKSKFHTGQNPSAWVATFDFILQPGKALEIFEKI